MGAGLVEEVGGTAGSKLEVGKEEGEDFLGVRSWRLEK